MARIKPGCTRLVAGVIASATVCGISVGAPAQAATLSLDTNNSGSFEYTGELDTLTILTAGIYRIDAYGAEGGAGGYGTAGRKGGWLKGDFNLSAGQVLSILIGGMGGDGSPGSYGADTGRYGTSGGGGGGGGTFVATRLNNAPTILISAGGGFGGTDRGGYGGFGGGAGGGAGGSYDGGGGDGGRGGDGGFGPGTGSDGTFGGDGGKGGDGGFGGGAGGDGGYGGYGGFGSFGGDGGYGGRGGNGGIGGTGIGRQGNDIVLVGGGVGGFGGDGGVGGSGSGGGDGSFGGDGIGTGGSSGGYPAGGMYNESVLADSIFFEEDVRYGNGFLEITYLGTAAVPEPLTIVGTIFGGTSLLVTRRRKSAKARK